MKTRLLLLLAILLPLAVHAADDLTTALQKGLFEEEANQNLPAAIQAYQALLSASDDQRKLAATALFRLGECHRKLGQTNDAIAQYQRLIRDFADQTTLVTLSRQNLTGLGAPTERTASKGVLGLSFAELSQLNSAQNRAMTSSEGSASISIEAQELARTERILAQLSGLDFSQVRRLLPTLVPDADSERYEKLLVDAQERVEQATGEERERWTTKMDQFRLRLMQRFDEIKQTLEKRAVQLRSQVAKQPAQAGRETSAGGAAQAATATLRAEAARADALLKQLQSMTRLEVIRVLPTVAPDELLNSLLEKRAQAERNLATLNVSFASSHPDVKAAEATLKNLHAQIAERVSGIMQGLAIKAAALKQQADEPTGAATPIDEEDQEIRRIQALIKNSPDLINAAGKEQTPLHVAAAAGKLSVVRFLLDNGAKPNLIPTANPFPPLLLAAENGHRAVVELLLARGADPNIKDGAALQSAAANGFVAIVDVLLANKADINRRGSSGTALHRAVYMKREAILERLLKGGADVNALDGNAGTPLHLAARRGEAAMIKLLLSHGADVNAKDRGDAPPLWRVWDNNESNVPRENRVESARMLLEGSASTDFTVQGNSPVHGALRLRSAELIEVLLKHKAAPDLPNREGLTPLHVIALRPNNRADQPGADLVSRLVAAGANPNRPLPPSAKALQYDRGSNEQSYAAYPPLCAAIARGDQEVAEALLASEADVNGFVVQGSNQYTALMYAVYSGSPGMVEAVLRYKPDLEPRTQPDGRTALYKAAERDGNMPEIIRALTKAGAKVDAADNGGWTPLHIAVERSAPKIVLALLEAGANPNAATAQGALPLSLARRKEGNALPSSETREELVRLLLQHGADETILRRRSITVTRRSASYEEEIFKKGTNDFNRFSLYELVARLYQHNGPNSPGRDFPDLQQIAIERIGNGGGTSQLLVDLESRASQESCTNDVWLEWGDRIEIREKEHALNAGWPGLNGNIATNMGRCISRSAILIIKGRTNQIELDAKVSPSGQTMSPSGQIIYGFRIGQAYCGLSSLIQKSGLLLTSSDLSRVRVTRRDPETGKSKEWILDETKVGWATDFWLRDGDVIEVPEK